MAPLSYHVGVAHTRTFAIVGAVLSLTACTAADDGSDDLDDDQSEIVAGTRSGPEDDAVVHVYSPGAPCTGVLVAPDVVVTALHCVVRNGSSASTACTADAAPVGATIPASAVRVSVGSNITSLVHYEGREIVTGPSRRLCNGDVAAIVLTKPVVGVTPRAVRTRPLAVGEKLTAVGWGGDGKGMLPDFRRKRSGIAVLDTGGGTYTRRNANGTTQFIKSGTKEIVTGESICQGDSGGPMFDASGKVAAVISRVQPGCVKALSVHGDVSYWGSLIATARAK